MTNDTTDHAGGDGPAGDGLRTGVVGAGVMGRDIAALLANAGCEVVLVDVDADALAAAESYLQREASAALADAGLATDTDPLADRTSYATDLDALADCEFVVEAISESLDAKRGLLAELEAVLAPDAVVGTNTSSLTASAVAAEAEYPERVVLFHFANPAIPRDVVEINGESASEDALALAESVARAMGKTPFRLGTERRANGLSRLSAAIKCAGTWELLDADAAEIEVGARNMGFPRGPLAFIDLIGLDIHLATVDNLAVEYGGRFAPPESVRERMETMVADGRAGAKDGEGFFRWEDGEAVLPAVESPHDVQPIVAALVNEAHRMVADGVADRETLNEILKRGSGGAIGPFDIEGMVGGDVLRDVLESRYAETGAGVFEPAETLG
ncbi:3-hydroxyacyl-CoA dehydrogenase [Haloarchaeobius litoreus]|uniref:3-hydroxyacyl-CoA dehydrogenase NAD-binding domain-containing protein n=1 Tax=Haloarchaeobius litoreus TaxID=755306 RepID=A0ABD6DDR9_9EURY|nr:3-hydroxyacyl-CoA dehydrogenase [Haloarchaeobius litoreus]